MGPLMKRRISILLILLLAGAVVNVAVAWGILWKKDWTGQLQNGKVWDWPRDVPTHWPDTAEMFVRTEGFGVLGLSYHALRPSAVGMEIFGVSTNQAGWPMLGLTWDKWQDVWWPNWPPPGRRSTQFIERSEGHPRQGWWNFGIPVDPSPVYLRTMRPFVRRMDDHLPIRPSWLAFAVNTLFYAVVLAILWLAVRAGYMFAFRYWTRARRGLCPKCAYPMGESAVCSECGHPVHSAAPTQNPSPTDS